MTKYDALNVAMNLINDALGNITDEDDLIEYGKELEEAKQKIHEMRIVANREEQRKEERKKIRNSWVAEIRPFVREVLSHTQLGMTAKDIFNDFGALTEYSYPISLPKLQYILLHDMEDEIEVIDNGRNAKTYRLKTA